MIKSEWIKWRWREYRVSWGEQVNSKIRECQEILKWHCCHGLGTTAWMTNKKVKKLDKAKGVGRGRGEGQGGVRGVVESHHWIRNKSPLEYWGHPVLLLFPMRLKSICTYLKKFTAEIVHFKYLAKFQFWRC